MAKRLDIYKLGVVLDVDGAKGLSTLKATDKELKAVDHDARKAEGSMGRFAKGLNRVTSALRGNVSGAGGGSILPGLANISQIIQGLPQIGQLAHALVSPLTDAAQAGIEFNAFLETNEIALKRHFGGSRDAARRFVGEVRDFAQKSPFGTEGLIKGVIYGTATGFSPQDALALIKDVGDAIASTGDLSEDMVQGVVRALSQMKAKGTVSAEEMEQLAERGIPAWEMLAHSIGKTVAETRKLSEQGKLSGVGAVEALRAEMRARYGGTMKEMESTFSGRMAAARDIVQSAQAKAMEGTTQNISDTLGMMLERGDAPARLAAVFDQVLTPVGGMIKASARGLLGGGLTAGLAEGITATKGIALSAISDLGLGTIKTLMSLFDMHSPSRVMADIGVNVVEGFENGLVDRTSRGFDRWAVALEKAGGEAFIKAVEAMSRRLGIDPAWMLNVMAFESGISAQAKNKGSSARGLIQFMNKTAKGLGLSNSNQFLGMSAMQQLPYVERYFKPYAGKMHNQGDVYAAVAGPAALSRSDRTLYRAGSKEYNANRVWDVNRDGVITAPEIGGLASGRGQFRGMGDVSSSNPLPVMIMGGLGGDFSAGDGGSFNPGAAPQVLWRARKELTQTIQDTGTVVVEVQDTAEQLIETNRDIAGVERLTFQALLPMPEAINDATVAAGQFAKTVITSGENMSKKLMSALSGIGGMMPQQQVGKKRGFFSKLLGVAAPFLGMIPGVGPLLSTLAGMGSAAAGGDWGSVLTQGVAGFSAGGAFRGSSMSSNTTRVGGVNLPSPGTATGTITTTGNTVNTNLSGARARGGPVSAGRAYLVGEHRAEVFTPEEDGFVHPSIDAFKRSQSSSGGGGGFSGGDKDGVWNQWREHFDRLAGAIEKFETMTPGEVLARGAKANPGAIGDGLRRAGTRDPKVVEWMNRRRA